MEEKIYERQIIKEALSERVVDEHQLDRHFNAADLQELYRFTPDKLPENKDKPTPKVPEVRRQRLLLITCQLVFIEE